MKALHCVKYFPGSGGMEAMVKAMAQGEAASGPVLSFLKSPPSPGTSQVQAGPNTFMRTVARHTRRKLSEIDKPDIALWHNGWGLDRLRQAVPAKHHVLVAHACFPGFSGWLDRYLPFSDGVVTVHPAMSAKVREKRDDVPVTQIAYLPALQTNKPLEPEGDAPVVGIVGRLVKQQKRLDRLPGFLRELRKRVPEARVELLGQGPMEVPLRKMLSFHGLIQHVRFLGWQQGEAYRDTLRRWRAGVFLSDYEGLSVASLELLTAGIPVIYPDFHPGQDSWAQREPRLHYPVGDVEAATARTAEVLAWNTDRRAEMRQHFEQWLAAYRQLLPERVLPDFLATVRAQPHRKSPSPPAWAGFQPVWCYNRGLREFM